jgi:hypothetical protein
VLTFDSTAVALLGEDSKAHNQAVDTNPERRVPDSSTDFSLCVVLVLFHWQRSLYVSIPLLRHRRKLIGVSTVYIFAGSILLDTHTVDVVFGSIIGIIGIAYVVLEFIPSIEPPQNMREADGGWGAETV